jgi:copper chaperone NosL
MISHNKIPAIIFSFLFFALFSCNVTPEPIELGKDSCSFCKMGFANQHFGAEIISNEGKVFKFDDMHCLLAFRKANTINNDDIKETFLVNFDEPHNFISVSKTFLLKSAELHSPMGGNIAAFSNENKLKEAMQKFNGEEISWKELINPK